MQKQKIVISATNLTEGGPLSILKDCLNFLSQSEVSKKYEIIAIVHRKNNIQYPNISYIEFPAIKKSYLLRFYYEYFYFNRLSKKINVHLWLSLHDMTPRVKANTQAVYMHNSIIFFKWKFRDLILDPKSIIWSLLYYWIYKINIHRNAYIIVQQKWLREKFSMMFNINKKKIIVSLPEIIREEKFKNDQLLNNLPCCFFYPAFPRIFKNFEVIGEASKILDKKQLKYKIFITIKGNENAYANYIFSKYQNQKNIVFTGILTREEVFRYYEKCNCMIFPSRLETWGLPISEFKYYDKPIIVSDLDYAHETSQNANKVFFFEPRDHEELAMIMTDVINNNFKNFSLTNELVYEAPFAKGWSELFNQLLTTVQNKFI